MMSKIVACLFVCVLVQIATGCPYSNGLGLVQNNLGLVQSGCVQNNVGLLPSNFGLLQNSLGYLPQGLSVAPYGGYNQLVLPESVLSVSTGSYASPNGFSILAENLEIVGSVGCTGTAPFLTTVNVNGALPTAGQAAVSYSTNSGVGLISGGCGQGLAGPAVLNEIVAPGYVGSNLGYSNVLNGNFLSSNLLAPAGGVYFNSPCGCY